MASSDGVRRETVIQMQNNATNNYEDPSDKIWSVYISEAERYDKMLVESWKQDMDGILIFVRTVFDTF
jgi:hypothetical protein